MTKYESTPARYRPHDDEATAYEDALARLAEEGFEQHQIGPARANPSGPREGER
ncbi:MAG TPA: hypothetical protein VNQ77_06375 [Frankiaceae bacterium]|nr:hypothetical protein [Frankiaceae bacterium]